MQNKKFSKIGSKNPKKKKSGNCRLALPRPHFLASHFLASLKERQSLL